MRTPTIALSLAALLTLAASSAGADEAGKGKALLAVGIVSDVGSMASGIACATLLTEGLGRALDNPGPNDGQNFPSVAAVCALNVALGAAGIALTVVGAKKLERGRKLYYSLNGVAGRF